MSTRRSQSDRQPNKVDSSAKAKGKSVDVQVNVAQLKFCIDGMKAHYESFKGRPIIEEKGFNLFGLGRKFLNIVHQFILGIGCLLLMCKRAISKN